MSSVSPDLLTTLAKKEAVYRITEYTSKVHYIINPYDVLRMKCGVIPSNHNVITLDYVVIPDPDLLMLHDWNITANEKSIRNCLVYLYLSQIQSIKSILL